MTPQRYAISGVELNGPHEREFTGFALETRSGVYQVRTYSRNGLSRFFLNSKPKNFLPLKVIQNLTQ